MLKIVGRSLILALLLPSTLEAQRTESSNIIPLSKSGMTVVRPGNPQWCGEYFLFRETPQDTSRGGIVIFAHEKKGRVEASSVITDGRTLIIQRVRGKKKPTVEMTHRGEYQRSLYLIKISPTDLEQCPRLTSGNKTLAVMKDN